MSISYTGTSVYSATLLIAQEKGFWQKRGVEVEMTQIEGDSNGLAALMSGQTVLSIGGGGGSIQAQLADTPVVMIGAQADVVTDILVVTPDIKTAADLKGTRMGVNQVGTSTEFNMRLVLKALGIDADKDGVTFIAVGSEAPRLAALKAGTIKAGFQNLGTEKSVEAQGLKVIARASDLKIAGVTAAFTVQRSWLAQNRDVAKAFLMGYMEATAFFKQNKAETLPIAARWSRLTDPVAVEGAWTAQSPILPPKVPFVSDEGIRNNLGFIGLTNAAAKSADPKKFYDNSLLDEIVKTGFPDTLYKK